MKYLCEGRRHEETRAVPLEFLVTHVVSIHPRGHVGWWREKGIMREAILIPG
jgi:hypothetical protein